MRDGQPGSEVGDEIDLKQLAGKLWGYKALIISSGFICFLIALVYVYLAAPRYEAKAFILPPSQSDVANFNYGRTSETELSRYGVKDVFDVFLRHFQGESLKRRFFEEVYLPSLSEAERQKTADELYAELSKKLVINQTSTTGVNRYSVVVRNSDPAKAKAWAEEYVEWAGVAAKAEMIKNVSLEAEVRARNLAQKIDTLRDSGLKVREDLIVRLREALGVAQQVGVVKPPLISGGLSGEVSAAMSGELTYMRGSQALDAAIKALEARRTDDPFIPGLRDLQVAYRFYQNLEVQPETVAVYRLDGPIELPDEPVGPKKSVLLVLGLFLGVLIGLMLATGRIVFFERRQG